MIPVLNNPDPATDTLNSAAAIRAAGWWNILERKESWPIDHDTAAEMLARAGQYAIDAEELTELVERGMIQRPGQTEDGFEWDASDIMAASGVLEFRQQFQPTPSFHDFKKHPAQLALEMARADGLVAESLKAGGQVFDVPQLLRLLVESGNREGREKIAALLKATLEVGHGVFIR